jgi:hypothetical protein
MESKVMSSSGNPFLALLRALLVSMAAALIGFFLATFLCIMSMAVVAAIMRQDLDFTVAYKYGGPIAAGVFFIAASIYWIVREFRNSR